MRGAEERRGDRFVRERKELIDYAKIPIKKMAKN